MPAFAARPALTAIVLGGLLAGAGDALFAFLFYGWKLSVFQTVAGGLIGREAARGGGVPTFLLGTLLHFLIATGWAALFWAASRRFPVLVRQAVSAGLGYGFIVYYGMNCIVLPLSALHTKAWPPPFAPGPVVAHIFLVGLPIALLAKKYTRPAR
ncbi:MAG TPA: hypothetical protein VIM71_06725 [Lacunisphaera sp.]